jgi:hypothetical protein
MVLPPGTMSELSVKTASVAPTGETLVGAYPMLKVIELAAAAAAAHARFPLSRVTAGGKITHRRPTAGLGTSRKRTLT